MKKILLTISLLLLTTCPVKGDQILINLGSREVVRGNQLAGGCLTDSQQFTMRKLKEQGFSGWKLAAEMEARFSWYGAIHSLNAREIAKIAGRPNAQITVVIGRKSDLKQKYGRLLAEATCKETNKTVQIWQP